jgi:N-acetyl-gamma-glutamylphosphate reductase
VYGLPELHREAIAKTKLFASPGCYPTAAILQLAPLFAQDLVQAQTVVIDAKSGISGAGRSPALPYHFPEAHESLEPYKIGQHRHIPEIEQELHALVQGHAGPSPVGPDTSTVAFTPHLVPMNRGILSGLLPPQDTDGSRRPAPSIRPSIRATISSDFHMRLSPIRYIKGSVLRHQRVAVRAPAGS